MITITLDDNNPKLIKALKSIIECFDVNYKIAISNIFEIYIVNPSGKIAPFFTTIIPSFMVYNLVFVSSR